MLTLLYFILILGLIVLVHEFGHFIFAKMFGVYVYEFSIGMGPKIFGKKDKKGETEYCIRAIPIGGFVQLSGEEIDDDSNIPKDKKMYSKPVWQRFLIMFFGAGNNFILAFILLFVYALIWKAPIMTPTISSTVDNYPASTAGITAGDEILEINGHKTYTLDDVQLYLTLVKEGKSVNFKVKKENGVVEEYKVTPEKEVVDGTTTYKYGITFTSGTDNSFLATLKYPFVKIGALFRQMAVIVKSLFTGGLSVSNLSGPVGIYSIVGETAKSGIANVIQLTALLCVNVGFINILPFPAFDGGRILFLIIEKIKGSPVSPKTENIIHSIGFILIMLLLLYVTFNDIIRLF